MSDNDKRQWEDIVRSLGGSEEQARSKPIPRESELDKSNSDIRPLGPRDYVVNEPDTDFTPPVPPSPVAGNPRVVLSWLAVIFGTLTALFIGIFRLNVPVWFAIGLGLAIASGIISLFFLLPKRGQRSNPRSDNDFGDGAQM